MRHTLDKRGWRDGPWIYEPDSVFWVDEATYLPCLILRIPDVGHLCGYVGIPQSHPVFGKGCKDVPGRVHGGITYSDHKITSVSDEHDRYADYYWLGFDCGHLGDLCPGSRVDSDRGGSYRDIGYVRDEVGRLAEHLFGMLSPLQHLARAADDGI